MHTDTSIHKMALRKVKGNLERMFDKNLTDLVRGIRNNKDSEVRFLSNLLAFEFLLIKIIINNTKFSFFFLMFYISFKFFKLSSNLG